MGKSNPYLSRKIYFFRRRRLSNISLYLPSMGGYFLKKTQSNKHEKKRSSSPYRWALTAFLLAVVLSAMLTLASEAMLDGAGMAVALLILLLFICLGILFDIIGVAVTAADPRPFHSMAAHKEKGAKQALMLLRNADRVSSICNDVVGDICGIVSGATGAVIVTQLQKGLNVQSVLVSVGVTALVSGLTIGGKAMGKPFAMKQSKRVVYLAGRVLYLFHRR